MKIETFLKQSPLFEVTRASRSLDRHVARIFQAGELNFLQALVLVTAFFESPKPVKPSRLAETLCTTRGNISHCVSSLEGMRFIRRRLDPEDARSFDIVLRPQGRQYALNVIRILDKMQRDFESHVGAAKLASALEIIKRVEEICACVPEG